MCFNHKIWWNSDLAKKYDALKKEQKSIRDERTPIIDRLYKKSHTEQDVSTLHKLSERYLQIEREKIKMIEQSPTSIESIMAWLQQQKEAIK